jgi:putative redox protein
VAIDGVVAGTNYSMEVSAVYLGGTKFEIDARGHRVICDQPVDNGGADGGMSPPELLLASLATCAGYYAVQYLEARGLPTDGLHVKVTAQKAVQPARLASFRIEVTVAKMDERHEAGLFRAVKACLIHNTLVGAPSIEIILHTPAVAHT